MKNALQSAASHHTHLDTIKSSVCTKNVGEVNGYEKILETKL